jgi:hypothetical protein
VQRFGGSAGVEALPGLRPSGLQVVDNYCGVNFGAAAGFQEKRAASDLRRANTAGQAVKKAPTPL